MEEVLKSLIPRCMAKKPNAMWDILLATENEAEYPTGRILSAKSGRLQTE